MKNIFGEEIPDKLYKYMPWRVDGETGINYTKEVLTNNQFYLSPVSKMNDPFDSGINLRFDCDKETLLEEQLSRPEISLYEKKQLIDIVKKMPDKKFRKSVMGNRYIESFKDKIGITCFSGNGLKDENNILMWSHYADSHKGICLVFDINIDFAEKFDEVNYCTNYPDFNYYKIIKENPKGVGIAYKYKFNIWNYEKEYRIIGHAKEKIDFNANALKAVILGCAFDGDIEEVKGILRKSCHTVKLYRAQKENYSFQLRKEFIGEFIT